MHPAKPTEPKPSDSKPTDLKPNDPKPTDLVPFLTTPRAPHRCALEDVSAALERVHKAGLRRGFVLVAPTLTDRDEAWWSALCARIRKDLRVGIVVVGGLGVERLAADHQHRPGKRCVAVMTDLAPTERTALIELAKSVCTGSRGLLAEATAAGTPAFEPGRIDGAASDGTLRELLRGSGDQTRAATAA